MGEAWQCTIATLNTFMSSPLEQMSGSVQPHTRSSSSSPFEACQLRTSTLLLPNADLVAFSVSRKIWYLMEGGCHCQSLSVYKPS